MNSPKLDRSVLTYHSEVRLRTIVSLDVCSSTAATYQNEQETLNQIQQDYSFIRNLCQTLDGEVIASMGDGLLLSFSNNQNALVCVAQFQQWVLARAQHPGSLAYRTGIHLGEVQIGAELNAKVRLIADKLQHLAAPGGICLSRAVCDSIRPKVKVALHDGGLHSIAGLAYAMRLYHLPPQILADPTFSVPAPTAATHSSRLTTVIFTAIQGYEEKLLCNQQQLQDCARRDFLVMTQRYRSLQRQIIKTMGSGLLLTFQSAVQAMTWAMNIQTLLQQQAESLPPEQVLHHQIGIHLGDVELIQQDIAGHAVNLTARLTAYAPPGGICFSSAVYDSVDATLSLPITHSDGQMVEVKGIPHPLRVYPLALSQTELQKLKSKRQSSAPLEPMGPAKTQTITCATSDELVRAYREGHRNFSGQCLKAFNLPRAHLVKANLSQCKLQEVNLHAANLMNADVSRSDLVRADLSGANLNQIYGNYANFAGANLAKAQLKHAHLSNTNLKGANLCGADLTGAKIDAIQLSQAVVDDETVYPDGKTRVHRNPLKRLWRSPHA
ncbi:hypothetical protein BST81_25770 [Leptolyngbya sp. 'hensonii']|uniref:pentapeptide repeat-containing protein n=1 Tax=Leptolyngbya sp. 'hensonii' TaxID=1922337 RepID=UPI00094F705B|nr:pentapeptide repeat-containing protein [Leptolyngbya sp. 'hensonii']OLP15514.1 hypothetical protein BST81_25770 [Leptolyngbya sp. 'hensonii']